MISNAFIKQFMLTNLEPLLNRALQLDPNIEALLKPLSQKTIGFNVTAPSFGFTLAFNDNSIHVFSSFDPNSDACIEASGLTLLQLFFNPQLPRGKNDLTLSGQASLLQAFMQLCKKADLQWESALSPYLGDTAAQTLGLASRQGWRYATQAVMKVFESSQDYIKYDAQWGVSAAEQDRFFDDINSLQADTERLERRLDNLMKTTT